MANRNIAFLLASVFAFTTPSVSMAQLGDIGLDVDANVDANVDLGGGGGDSGANGDAAIDLGNGGGDGIEATLNLMLGNGSAGGGNPGVAGEVNALVALGGTPGTPIGDLDLDAMATIVLGGGGNAGDAGAGGPGAGGGPIIGGGGGGGGAGGGGGSSTNVLTLWASLSANQQQQLIGQCFAILANPTQYKPDWVQLCRMVAQLPVVRQIFVAAR